MLRWLLGSIGVIVGAVLAVVWGVLPPQLPVPGDQEQIISRITVINPGVERLVDQTIIVRHGVIEEIRPRVEADPVSVCEGCFAMPGLIDSHVHTPPQFVIGNQRLFALLYLRYGVTSVRDVGQSEPGIADFANSLNAGEIVGPHMYRCGPVLEGSPPSWPVAEVVVTAQEGRAVVMCLADEGVDCIKAYNELNPEAYAGIAAAAAERNLPLIGHVPHAVGLVGVADFEVQHFTGIPYLLAPRPPKGWDWRDEDVSVMSEENIQAGIRVAQSNRLSITPTLANLTQRLTDSDRNRFPPTEGSLHMPGFWASSWRLVAGHPTGEAAISMRLDMQSCYYEIVRQLSEAGIDVLAGTDTLMPWVVPGEALHLELAGLEKALGSPEAALQAATGTNGRHVAPGEIGVLSQGARADILLLAEDPTLSLSAVSDWKILFADGRRYNRETVDAWLVTYDEHFHSALYDTVVSGLVSLLAGQFGHQSAEK